MSDKQSKNDKYTKKRQFPRIKSTNLLNYEYDDIDGKSKVQAVGITLSLSEGGLSFEADRNIPIGTSVDVQFTLLNDLIAVSGVIIYQNPQKKNTYVSGLRFQKISEEHKIIVRDRAGSILPKFIEQ